MTGIFPKPKSLDAILANFKKVNDQLLEYAKYHDNQGLRKHETIKALEAEVRGHASEAERAMTISGNIERIFSV